MFANKYRYIFIILLSVYSFLNILFTEGNRLFSEQPQKPVLLFTITFLVLLLWEGNRIISRLAEDFKIGKIHPLIVFFTLSIILLFCLSLLTTVIFSIIYPNIDLSLTLKLMIGFTFRVNLFLHCINAIVFFMNKYRTAQIESEQLKKMHAEAKFEALRNQINPHFLFNSFNVLSSLVYKDAESSARFIEQLSNVYRYLLYNQDNRVVTIAEEVKFLTAYIYLLKIRFRETLVVDITIEESIYPTLIAPATLQMLIENAIKHNVVSSKSPLQIKIYNKADFIIVENSINLKKVKVSSSQLGLKNITMRYNFLSADNHIEVSSNDKFTVKIPLLKTIK